MECDSLGLKVRLLEHEVRHARDVLNAFVLPEIKETMQKNTEKLTFEPIQVREE